MKYYCTIKEQKDLEKKIIYYRISTKSLSFCVDLVQSGFRVGLDQSRLYLVDHKFTTIILATMKFMTISNYMVF
jgi:hypothetical protein